jgi:hypothetical protein
MQVAPFTFFTTEFQPAALAADRLWKRTVADFATAVIEPSPPAEASEMTVSGTATAAAITASATAVLNCFLRILMNLLIR